MWARLGVFVTEYGLAAAASSVTLPALAAGATTVLYIASAKGGWKGTLNHNPSHTCLYGTGIGIALWLLLSVLYRRAARVDGANPSTYGELTEAFARLQERVAVAEPDAADAEQTIAAAEAHEHADYVSGVLYPDQRAPSIRWVIASGYVDLWKRVHRIEEALMEYEPISDLVRDALIDDTRLQDSTVAQATQLQRRLGLAVKGLDQNAVGEENAVALLSETASPPAVAAPSITTARNALRQIRLALNEFRDARREGLVRARNLLLLTVALTGATAYALVVVAILAGAKPREIAAAAAFYLVGSLLGLFKLLAQAATGDSSSQDDFGFAIAQLIQTPLFSGLAAIGGIVLTAILPTVVHQSGQPAGVVNLGDVFNLSKNQTAFVVAAVFGLSPNLLITRLQSQVAKFKGDLTSSDPGEAAPRP